MLNHKWDAREGGLRGPKQFVISSGQDYSIGEQVYDSYGRKTSFELLVTYGFVPDENENNGVALEPHFNVVNPDLIPLVKQKL